MKERDIGYVKMLRSLMPKPEVDNRKVYVVAGPPGGGKTTWVNQRKAQGDLVVDIDQIGAALTGSNNPHEDYTHMLDEVMAVREALYGAIESRAGKWNNAYVISTASKADIRKLAARLDGEIVMIKPPLEKCIEQITADGSREGRTGKYITLAKRWYEREEE